MKQSTALKSDPKSISLRFDVVSNDAAPTDVIDLSFQGRNWQSDDRQSVILDIEASGLLEKAMHAYIRNLAAQEINPGPYAMWLASELDEIHCNLSRASESAAE